MLAYVTSFERVNFGNINHLFNTIVTQKSVNNSKSLSSAIFSMSQVINRSSTRERRLVKVN